jgi:membrane protease YdiL (CAAX protease family)
MFLGGELAGPPFSFGLIFQLLVSFLVFVLFNGEELGWRGYALPRLQAKRSALVASLIVGGMWALFHLSLFFDRGMADFRSMPPLSYLLLAMAWSIIFTWVFNNTRGSVLLAMLLHAASNVWRGIYRPESADFAVHVSLYTGVMWLAALIVIALYGAARLSRKPRAELPL